MTNKVKFAPEFEALSSVLMKLGKVDKEGLFTPGEVIAVTEGQFGFSITSGNGTSFNVIPNYFGESDEDRSLVVTIDPADKPFLDFITELLCWFGTKAEDIWRSAIFWKVLKVMTLSESNSVPAFKDFDSFVGRITFQTYATEGKVDVLYDVLLDSVID